jgi:hypothetical protein
LLVQGFGKIKSKAIGQLFPGFVMVYGGINNNSIKIKKAGFNIIHIGGGMFTPKVSLISQSKNNIHHILH